MLHPHDATASLLGRLRFLVRTYVFVEGAAVVLAVLGLTFWISFALDRWLELAIGWRIALLIGATATAGGFLLALVLRRFFRDFHPRALALILERRFPRLDDRLITTVELADESPHSRPPLTESMLARTAMELGSLLSGLRLGDVFNVWPMVRAVAVALLLLASVGAFVAAAGETTMIWFRRNILLRDEFWPRKTDLVVRVLADPGERVVPFKNGLYKHPQGANLTLVAEVPEGKLAPELVQLTYRLEGGGGATETLARVGDRSFRFTISGLQNTARLWFYGGDYASRTPLVAEVVAAPQIDRVRLECTYPRYTGKSPEVLPVSGSQLSLPAATEFVLRADANKPLQGFRISSETFSLVCTREGAVLRQPPEGPETPLPLPQPMLSSKGTVFAIPCVLSTQPAGQLVGRHGAALPLRLPPTATLSLQLHDADDIISAEPTRLTINSIPDEPPIIKAELKGIGNSITRQATIPVQGAIQDDYGVVEPRFDYRLDSQSAWEPRAFTDAKTFLREVKFAERFSVVPLDLNLGQKLTLAVSAGDAFDPLTLLTSDPLSLAGLPLSIFAHDVDELTGPHRVQGDRYTFEVVTNEELLAQIAARELNLRQRFEQIIVEVKETRKDLQLQRSKLDDWFQPGATDEAVTRGWEDLSVVAERSVSRNAKNRNETISIEESFRDIHAELNNNAVPNIKEVLARIEEGVVGPLNLANNRDYVRIDEALTRLKQALEARRSVGEDIDLCVDEVESLIVRLEQVLAQMLKIESYNEALQLLREIIQTQEELKKKTEQERKRQAIKDLQGE